MTIGERIKNRRIELGIMQNDLAELIGVSKQTLYKYENNIISNIPSDKIEDIAKALNVSPAYLMGWNGVLKVAEPTSDYNVDSKEYKWIARNARKLDDEEQRLLIDLMKKVFNRLEKTEEEDD